MLNDKHEIELIQKLKDLPPERLAEVEDFVDFLRGRDDERRLTHSATKLTEGAFNKVWDNENDAEYDRL